MVIRDKLEKNGKTKGHYVIKNSLSIAMISFAIVALSAIPIGISVKLADKVKAEAEAYSSYLLESEETSESESIIIPEIEE
ncbi:MAG: hypothetical protein MJ241_02635 [Bacilli bacterium]|nr:hypothetical protein [Bacilli bacterium]